MVIVSRVTISPRGAMTDGGIAAERDLHARTRPFDRSNPEYVEQWKQSGPAERRMYDHS